MSKLKICVHSGCPCNVIPGTFLCKYHTCACGKEKLSSNDRLCQDCSGKKGEFSIEKEFMGIVGLDALKESILSLQHQLILDSRRKISDKPVLNMIFKGNPGTGKTSFARLMSNMLFSIGYLREPKLKEVQRGDLVAEYVGQTAPKTKKVIEEAKGGVLFVDEAYRLSMKSGTNDFGTEAIEELMGAMNTGSPVIIFAGYPEEMDKFIEVNPGIYRRIRQVFVFPDYSPREIGEILINHIRKKGFKTNATLDEISEIISSSVSKEVISRMNGGIVDHIFEHSKKALDMKIDIRDKHPSMMIEKKHIEEGVATFSHPMPPALVSR